MKEFIEKYITINLSDYDSFGFDLQINVIIIAVAIALCIGAFVIYRNNCNVSLLIKRLIRKECFSPETALSIKDLGLSHYPAIARLLLSNQGIIRRIVKYSEDREETSSEISDTENSTKDQDGSGALAEKDIFERKIFIPEENIDIARQAIESKNTSLASTILTCVIIIAVGSILVFSMPKILTVINGWLSE
jgi:hypothetical protein